MNRARSPAGLASRDLWWKIGGPIALLVLVTIVGALALQYDQAERQNREFVRGSRALVGAAMEGAEHALANTTKDFALWNHAYRAVSLDWDSRWVRENYFSAAVGGMVLYRADRQVRFSWFDAPPANPAAYASKIANATGSLSALSAVAAQVKAQSMVLNRFAVIDGQLVLVSAAPVSWETEALRRADRRIGPVDYVACVDVIDGADLARIGKSLGLRELSFRPGGGSFDDSGEFVSWSVRDDSGATAGRLIWRNERPGTHAFFNGIWPIVCVLGAVGLLALVVTRHLVGRQVEVIAHAEAAAEANRLKSEFLATMSHELRTPLNAIIGYAELIQEQPAGPAQQNERIMRADAARINAAAAHLLGLINEILDHARIEAGRAHLQTQALDVTSIMEEVSNIVAPLAEAKGNILHTKVERGAEIVLGDRVRLTQCLLNLAGNAVKFTEDGTIGIRACAIRSKGRPYISFEVSDSGRGIEEAVIRRLFEPFSQGDVSPTRRHSGAGLGLSITRGLARAMGGDVVAESTLGTGSTFRLNIPAAEAKAAPIAA